MSNQRFVLCSESFLLVYNYEEAQQIKKIEIEFDEEDNSNLITYIKDKDYIVIFNYEKLTVYSMKSYQVVNVIEVDIEGQVENTKIEMVDCDRVMIGRNNKIVIVNILTGRKEYEIEDSKIGNITAMMRLNERYIICASKMESEFRKVNYWHIKFVIFDYQLRKYTMDNCNQDEIITEMIRMDDRRMITTNGHSIDIWKGE